MPASKRSAAAAGFPEFGRVTKPSNNGQVPKIVDDDDDDDYNDDDEEGGSVDLALADEDALLGLSTEQLNLLEFGDPGEVEAEADVVLDDEHFEVPDPDMQRKASFYEAMQIPSAAEQLPADVFLQILQGDPEIKELATAFAVTCMATDRDVCPVPTNDFLRETRPQAWESYCPGVDALWDHWLAQCRGLGVPDHTLNTAAKISGPLRANLNTVWHYPTWNVGRAMFGFTADSKSSCLAFQNRKIGPNPRVCTNDLIPIRAHFVSNGGVVWENILPNAAQVIERSEELTMKLLDASRVVILVGKAVLDRVTARLEADPTKEVHKLFVPAEGITIFREDPYILVVRGRESGKIENLIFISYHSQAFFHCSDQRVGVYHDFLWNAACAIANVPVVGKDVFYRATSPKKSVVVAGKKLFGQFSLAVVQRGREKSNGVILPDAVALEMFKPTITKNAELWAQSLANRGDRSVVELVVRLLSAKGRAKGRLTQAAGGWPGLAKGRATQAANGYPALKRGLETQRSQGFPNLRGNSSGRSKGHATQKDQKVARIEAVLNAYQSRQLLAKDKASLNQREKAAVGDLERLQACLATGELTPMCRKWRDTHVVYWSKKNPYGMRFEGDKGPAASSSYDDRDHPCLSLYSQFSKKDKDRLVERWTRGVFDDEEVEEVEVKEEEVDEE